MTMKVTITLTEKESDVFTAEIPSKWFSPEYFPSKFICEKYPDNNWEDLVCDSVDIDDNEENATISVSCW
jgi:hypothetical protein